jgi:hypothetical protein
VVADWVMPFELDPAEPVVGIMTGASDDIGRPAPAGRARFVVRRTDRVDRGGHLAVARRWPERTWAVEGCQGIGGHIAHAHDTSNAAAGSARHSDC